MNKETILHAAIQRSDGTISTGKCHGDIIKRDSPGTYEDSSTFGFATSKNRFVSRVEAANIAYESGQIPSEHYELIKEGGLISENLWDYCEFKYHCIFGYYK